MMHHGSVGRYPFSFAEKQKSSVLVETYFDLDVVRS